MRKLLMTAMAGLLLAFAAPTAGIAAPAAQSETIKRAGERVGHVDKVWHRRRHVRRYSGWRRWHERWRSRRAWHSRWYSRRHWRWGSRRW